ncbi:hypothetical protein ACFCYN_06565 [Gottfriedia sp. NPDC056225]|uniref:hypothetical protein n=1 Tax=Gottfriedia sp. NPDC056225 TaxID=3345751 RepID=UPI001559C390|nr:hypothetical protein HPK19_15240 [Arthrobacter citreus]
MEIKEWVGQARNLFIKKEYLQIILPIEEKIVEFNGINEKLFVRFSKKAPFIEVIDRSIPQLRVNFTKDGWESLYSGSQRLSLLLKLNDASFDGNYRLLLLIETIFQYTGVESDKKLLENC